VRERAGDETAHPHRHPHGPLRANPPSHISRHIHTLRAWWTLPGLGQIRLLVHGVQMVRRPIVVTCLNHHPETGLDPRRKTYPSRCMYPAGGCGSISQCDVQHAWDLPGLRNSSSGEAIRVLGCRTQRRASTPVQVNHLRRTTAAQVPQPLVDVRSRSCFC
jgi:hypothetical protein